MIFPEITYLNTKTGVEEEIKYGKEWAYNFEENKFIMKNGTPVIVEGVEALKIFIVKAIRTTRYKYMAHSWDYGCELEDIIGKSLPIELVKSETQRVIEEALIFDSRIKSVFDFNIKYEGEKLFIFFRVLTQIDDQLEVAIYV